MRELEDFARLWVCGITTNTLTALPSHASVTKSWGDIVNPNYANPTIYLFQAAVAVCGIGYLTNTATAVQQSNESQYLYVGRGYWGRGRSITLNSWQNSGGWAGNHFIWCGVAPGSGGLNLTVADGNGVTLAQTAAYIQIKDIKDL